MSRHRLSQQRFRSWPSFEHLADVQDICYAAKGKKGAVQIALYGLSDAVAKNMLPLGERLLSVLAGGVIKLAQFGVASRDFYHLAANGFGFAFQGADEQSRRSNFNAFAETFLEGTGQLGVTSPVAEMLKEAVCFS